MTSPRTLKIAYPFIRHIPAALAKAKAQVAAARRSAGRKQRDTTEKRNCRSLVCSSRQGARNSRLPVPGGSRYGHDQQRSDTPVQPNVRALKRPAAVIRRRQWGRLRENHARGEIPRGAGELPAV